jgi:hypothetical protein
LDLERLCPQEKGYVIFTGQLIDTENLNRKELKKKNGKKSKQQIIHSMIKKTIPEREQRDGV